MKEYMQKNLSSVTGFLNLTYLSRLERKLLDHFKLEGFSRTGHGTFLEYLVKHPQMLEEAGGGKLFINNQDATSCGFRPSHQDVYEFIRQCESLEESVFPVIEAALRSHFRVKDSKELGYGTLSNMVKMVQRQIKSLSNHGNLRSLVLYEAALLFKEFIPIHSNNSYSVGLLGELSKERALSCLLNAPLLEDLAEWSQWDLVFEPQHGSLKDFIERNCDKKAAQLCVEGSDVLNDLVAMEVKPGVLLRLTTNTSPDLFAKAAKLYDPVGTAGHLVSIVTTDGLTNAPLALLANHMETALAALGGLQACLMMNGGTSSDRSAQFILDCLIRIPIRLCKSLLHKVFLEPFSRVIGQSESKDLMLQTAKCSVRYQNKLHQLGILLGVTEWMRDFHGKLDPAKLSIITSKTTQFVDSSSVSSRSSAVGLSEGEDSESDSDSEPETTSSSSGDEGKEKFVLAMEEADLSPCDEKLENEGDVEVQTSTAPDPADGINTDGCVIDEDQEKETECRNIIKDIRKSDFGIGVELNEEGKKLVEVHQNRLGRSLERLSTELYSKDTHFVLELIQNADDNRYPACNTTPSLLFVVESNCITLLNNECGFEENNIRAICDVGHSTKGKHKYGYIGQKGIGFKSVFKVTNNPEIHSNGFHIRFDKNSGPMGYILPHWVEDERPVDLTDLDLAAIRWTTKIILPLKSQNQQTQNLFHDVDPSLLLFLHRLRSITIINKVRNQDFSVIRRDLNDNILEIKHKVGADHWLVIKTILDARKIKENVECTELALAFKLDLEKKNAQNHNFQPEKQPVFAFLPLRNFGFRFIIQGDFDIPSSREDIDRDSPWNQWLRSEIPLLFLQAMEVFNNHPNFKGLEGLCHFLKFIPLPDEILDFFRPIAGQIIHLLKAKACLPTKTDKDGKTEYRLPSQTAITHDVLVQEVIDSELLQKHLNLAYLNPRIQSELSPALASVLGVHKLTSADIIAVTKAIAKEIEETDDVHSDDCMKRIAKLMVCNYRSLEQEYSNFDHLVELTSIPIIPLADGTKVSLKGQAIFFPLFDEENSDLVKSTKGIQELYRDLKTIHPKLLTCLDNLGNSQVRKLLEKMDVHYLKPEKVVFEHILPILKEHKWQKKTNSTVISYVVFLKMHCQDGELEQFRAFIPVLTNKGFVCPSQVNVNFPCNYKNVINLLVDFPGVDWHLLDSCYLKIDNDSEGWRRFFTVLGVRDLFIFRKKNYNFTKQELASSPWASVSEFWPKTADDMYVVEDHLCEELHTLLTMEGLSDEVKLMQRVKLLTLLDKNWDSGCRISQYCTADLFDSRGQRLKDDVNSSLSIYLTTLPWLPAHGCGSSTTYLRPNEVYLKEKHLFELLSHHVSYVHCELLEKSSFAAFTGIKTSLTVEVMINHFKSWCVQSTPSPCDNPQGAEFQTSADHIHSVYTYLGSNCSRHQLKELFERFPAVFVPTSRDSVEELWVGKFYHQKDVCWTDPTKMFLRYKSLINAPNGSIEEPHILDCYYSHWEDMRDLFQQSLNIERIPTMKQYVELLVLMCSEASLPNNEALQDVSVIYAVLAEKCRYTDSDGSLQLNNDYCQTLKGMLKDEKVFAAKDNLWVSLTRHPIIPDDKHLERVFKTYTEVCLLNLPVAERNTLKTRTNKRDKPRFDEEDRKIFLKICGVKRLSECVMVEAQTEDFRQCPAIQNFVHSVVPYIQRFLYGCEDYHHVYKELIHNNIVRTLKSIAFIQVGKLYLQYQLTLPNTETLYEKEDIVCHLKGNKELLYIQKDHIASRTDICRELVKLFNCAESKEVGKELERFLQGLISCLQDAPALKRLLQKEDVGELPEDEERWEVPQVCEPRPQPVRLPALIQTKEQDQKETPECKDSSNDGEILLTSWPPKSSLHGVPDGRTNKAVDNVMRMWPPPAGPPGSSEHPHPPQAEHSVGGTEPSVASEEKRDFYQSQPVSPKPNTNYSVEQPLAEGRQTQFVTSEQTRDSPQSQVRSPLPPGNETPEHPPAPGTQPNNTSTQQSATLLAKSNFNGYNSSRPALPLDVPIWTREQPYEEVLEQLVIHSAVEKPQAVVFSEGNAENAAIGEWGERLVHAFLLQWKESNCEHKPQEVLWVNEKGESGLPYDFQVVFTGRDDVVSEATFLEVKSTVKAEKNFVQLSAREVELALRAKEHYHMYRVYNAGDSQNVRLCRIENLAKCLNAKQLALFLFV
uniref:Wu:fj29h11 n=2 Tax=Callorhinchus milii TaxID=7868 RepID=A0A4W3JPJ6_CALMI